MSKLDYGPYLTKLQWLRQQKNKLYDVPKSVVRNTEQLVQAFLKARLQLAHNIIELEGGTAMFKWRSDKNKNLLFLEVLSDSVRITEVKVTEVKDFVVSSPVVLFINKTPTSFDAVADTLKQALSNVFDLQYTGQLSN